MNARDLGFSVIGWMLKSLLIVLFTVLVMLRGVVRFLLRAYIVMAAIFFGMVYFVPLNVPTAALVVNGIAAVFAAIVSYKYDTILQWLEPEGRTVFFDA